MTDYILGIITGLIMATFNAVMYKKQVQEKIMKIFSKKNPQVVDMSNPLDDIKFNE